MKLCRCGCGQEVAEHRTWIHGHNAKEMVGEKNPMHGVDRSGENGPMYGKYHTEGTRERLKQASFGNKSRLGCPASEGSGNTRWYDYLRSDGREIRVQGPYELKVAEYLDEVGEEWEYVGRSQEHSFRLKTGERYYADFHLPRRGLYLDPKGFLREGQNTKALRAQREYSDSGIIVLLGVTYLKQLKELLVEHISREP